MDKAKAKLSKKEMETMQDRFMDNLGWAMGYPIEVAAKLLRWYEKLDESCSKERGVENEMQRV